MSRAQSCRCVQCLCSDERPCAGGCVTVLHDVFVRLRVCSRCDSPKVREKYELEALKAHACIAGV